MSYIYSNSEKPEIKGWIPCSHDARDLPFIDLICKKENYISPKMQGKRNEKEKKEPDEPRLAILEDLPPLSDQGALGSCVSNAISTAMAYTLTNIMGCKYTPLSRLFIYYNYRFSYEKNAFEDNGASPRDTLKSISKTGVCSEYTWPYIIDNFNIEPTKLAYERAKEIKPTRYYRIDTPDMKGKNLQILKNIKQSITYGYMVIFGMWIFDSFEVCNSLAKLNTKYGYGNTDCIGVFPYPSVNEQTNGGHSMTIVGWDDDKEIVNPLDSKKTKGAFIIQNSWSARWGVSVDYITGIASTPNANNNGGYGYVPYEYILSRDGEVSKKIHKKYKNSMPDSADAYLMSDLFVIVEETKPEETGDQFKAIRIDELKTC
jgi:C1A family cysteine protease